MRILQLQDHLNNEQLKEKLLLSRGSSAHSRWQILYLIQIGKQYSAEVIAPLVGLSHHSVYKIVEAYNKQGVASVICKPRGGRTHSLRDAQTEAALFKSIEHKAGLGLVKTANDMRAIVEKKVGNPVSDDYLWDL